MMKKTVQGLIALAVLLLSNGAAQARDIVQNLQFDVFVLGGGSTLVDVQNWQSADRPFHSRFELGPKFTFGVAVPYGRLISIETAFSYGPNNLYVTNLDLFPHVPVEYPVRFYNGSLSGVVHAPFSRFHLRPYVEGGVEYDRYSPTPAAITTATNQGFATVSTAPMAHNDKFGVNVGVGVDRKIMKRLTFRIDLRDHITGSPAFGLPPRATTDSLGASYPVTGRGNNIEYTAGFLIHLGKL
jgi:opacity protein-like surface antigen